MTGAKRKPLTLADITARERWHLELAIHEAAHAVAAVALGGTIRNAVVSNSRVMGVEGLTTVTDMPRGRESEIAYSGPWAQARFRAGRRPTQRDVFSILSRGAWKDDRALTAAGGTHLGTPVVPLMERCWPAVVAVAKKLHRDGEVHQEDVLAALGVTDGGGRTSVQLAGLRSGTWSVPNNTKKPVPA
ncbi:hypothetical protein MKUB_55870 [Mycobacterium kubicae]|uniref:Peptidase M41 domain-containing protein n=1 Tax=Mycobacterium kubicae TaxID=120959 RepID=A0AAX1J3L6_9MYCO|nr:hypothetical protein [Mycobacterium kubicae]MCV7094096.1 hypothetical protein [Mycobacterium kubicae]ORV98442.1 hypothetical protein AWC13_13390 [Mycobacterium kubicae]QNI12538.1 hypothetical protein GAN18_16135 [Mycobacterium kubicae]QPI36063.1 hypothetical protein I2456_15930 [Mycobacterium kubicae]GFG68097.1 hypothetical protein MKUB_55870 [Mycobacterium kubicae]